MRIIKPGRILTLMIPDRDDNKKIKPTKFEVISVYEHHVLTRNVRPGMSEPGCEKASHGGMYGNFLKKGRLVRAMLDEVKRNGSGYYDPTDYEAIKHMEEDGMEMKRGDIYMTQRPGKEPELYLNISAEGRTGMFASLLMLTDRDDLKYGAAINCRGMKYVGCDLVMYMKKEYLTDFVKCATADEMAEVDIMLAKALGLPETGNEGLCEEMSRQLDVAKKTIDYLKDELKEAEKKIPAFPVEIEKELLRAETQRDLYKELYEQMCEKMIG